MIINSEKRGDVTLSGVTDTTGFTIKATGKAFKALISGLYSNKPKSIMREICTNAYDGHIMAGKLDVPFEVNLPTRMNPIFSVRDFGVSMDEDTIFNLYSTLFDSTKEQTNDQVGCFGLGSKSPFAYTDTYSIETFLDGMHKVYTANVDPEGVPQISKMGETPYDRDTFITPVEGNEEETPDNEGRWIRAAPDTRTGVKVSFPVDIADIDKFVRAAMEVLPAFDVLPIVTGGMQQYQLNGLADRTVMMAGDRWALYASDRDHDDGVFIRQGCVIYPISKKEFADNYILSKVWNSMESMTVVLDVPIGTAEVSLSRESLSYVPQTVANLTEILESFVTSVRDFVTSSLNAHKTKWEAMVAREQLITDSRGARYGYSNLVTSLIEEAEWQGQKLSNSFTIRPGSYDATIGTYLADKFRLICPKFRPFKTTDKWGSRKDLSVYHRNNKVLFVIESPEDELKHTSQRLANFVRSNPQYDQVIWIRGNNLRGSLDVLRSFGYPPYKRLKDMEKPAKTTIKSTGGAALWAWNPSYSEMEKIDSLDVTEKTFYLSMHRSAIMDGDSLLVNSADIRMFMRRILREGDFPKDVDIVFIAKSRKDIDTSSMKCALKQVRKSLKKVSIDALVYNNLHAMDYACGISRLFRHEGFDVPQLKGGVLYENFLKYAEYESKAGDTAILKNILDTPEERDNIRELIELVNAEIQEYAQDFRERFPLVSNGGGYDEEVKEAVFYINAVLEAENKGTR